MKPKQETLEKAADKLFPNAEQIGGETYTAYKGFIEGAKWQSKRMYSEEEILNLLIECAHFYNMDEDYKIKNDNVKEWFSYRKKI